MREFPPFRDCNPKGTRVPEVQIQIFLVVLESIEGEVVSLYVRVLAIIYCSEERFHLGDINE